VGILEIERDVTLAPLTPDERRDLGASHAVAPRRLDLDHVRAEVAQEHRAERPGEILAEVEDADAFQRTGHHMTPAARRAAISAPSWPSDPSTWSVCSPARGCGPFTAPRVRSRKMVTPTCVVGPMSGSTTSTTEPVACSCGWPKRSWGATTA